jgi:hypothetical protein
MVPASPDDLLGDEFVRWESVGAEYGYASTIARLFRADGTTCIAKLGSPEDGRRELTFYRQLAPSTPVRVPGFIGGAHDDERSLVLLEDVAHARQGDSERRPFEDVAPVLLQAARLHRRWWDAAPDELPWWGRTGDQMAARVLEQRAKFVGHWGDCLDDHSLLIGLEDRLDPSAWAGPTTVVHSDLHLDNVLFDDAGPIVMDWQTVGRGPGVVDAARWLLESLTLEDRHLHRRALLTAYVEELGHGTVAALESAVRALTVRMFAGMVCGFANFDPATCTPRQHRLISADIHRASATLRAEL